MSKGGHMSLKRQRYVNVFLLLGKDEDMNMISQVLEEICQEYECEHSIRKSFLGNFYYVKVICSKALLEEVKSKIDVEFSRYSNIISWMKSEVVEVK